ncbi:MAG: hypothetical protein WCF84_13295 [Anaerolineae bacterium]
MPLVWTERIIFKLGLIVWVLASLSGCAWLREPLPTAPPVASPNPTFPVVQVTADQIARAMEEDRFFAEYGQTTLRIQGTVFSVKRQDADLVVGLDTTVTTKVMCDLGNYFGIVRVGATITIQSAYPQQDASRQASAVMFRNCTIP